MKSRSLCLLGRDFPDLGPLALAHFPHTGGALALSRGLHPKPYRHTDPNEDGALLFQDGDAALLAVADGYNGATACERALEAVRGSAPSLLIRDADGFETRVLELVRSVAKDLSAVAPSCTCLLIVVLVEGTCNFASFGDSSLFRASSSAALNVANELNLRPTFGSRPLPRGLWAGSFEREPGERIAAVTDGITNFVPSPEKIHALLRDSVDDAAAATAIARAALNGGAGDNVAVVTYS